jgi:tetratricopeptide (TPR) repeat protein
MSIDGLPWRIERGPREHDPLRKRERAIRNQRLAGLEIDEVGRLPQLINGLADAAHALGETESAIELYRECLSADQSTSSERLEAYYGLLSCLDVVSASGQTNSARQVQLSLCVNALEQFPLDAQLLCAMGGYLQGQGRIDLALRAYETAFQFGRVNPLVWHLDEITAIAAVCWARALLQQEDSEQALAVLQLAVKRDGHTPRLARAMIDIYIEQARREDALAQLEHLAIAADARSALASAIRGACVASQKNWIGARAYLQSAYDAGCHDMICFRWLCATLMNLDQIDHAREVAEHWQQLYPTDAQPQQLLAATPAPSPAKPAHRRHSRIDAVKKSGLKQTPSFDQAMAQRLPLGD